MSVELPKDADVRECDDELASLSWADGVPAPVDADGEVVPLNTFELYTDDGETVNVGSILYNRYSWHVRSPGSGRLYRLDMLHRTKQDSWEKLEEDFDRCIEKSNICMYFSPECSCQKCARPDSDTCGCTASVFKDIKRRTRKLRGEGDA